MKDKMNGLLRIYWKPHLIEAKKEPADAGEEDAGQ